MSPGLNHDTSGLAKATSMVTRASTTLYSAVSSGVNLALSDWPLPALSTDPSAGLYSNTPGTFAAALNCTWPSAVP